LRRQEYDIGYFPPWFSGTLPLALAYSLRYCKDTQARGRTSGDLFREEQTMGFFERLFGRGQPKEAPLPKYQAPQTRAKTPQQLTDDQALERYRYMLRTAPPEQVEEAHREAFEKLTPAQRAQLLQEMSATLPAAEAAQVKPGQDDPQTLARLATRAEMRNPGYMARTFTKPGMGGRGGMGGGMMGGLFGTMVAGFAGSLAAMAVFDALDGGLFDAPMEEPMADTGDAGADAGADGGWGDMGGGDMGGWDAEM
jgi:hypothetical protein